MRDLFTNFLNYSLGVVIKRKKEKKAIILQELLCLISTYVLL